MFKKVNGIDTIELGSSLYAMTGNSGKPVNVPSWMRKRSLAVVPAEGETVARVYGFCGPRLRCLYLDRIDNNGKR